MGVKEPSSRICVEIHNFILLEERSSYSVLLVYFVVEEFSKVQLLLRLVHPAYFTQHKDFILSTHRDSHLQPKYWKGPLSLENIENPVYKGGSGRSGGLFMLFWWSLSRETN